MPSSSAPAGASGNPAASGPRASAYQPAAQPGADALIQSLATQFSGSLGNNFAGTPGGWAYPQAQAQAQTIADPNNPYLQQAIGAGEGAFQNFSNEFGSLPGAIGSSSSWLAGQIPNLINTVNQVAGNAPALSGAAANLLNLGNIDSNFLQGVAPGAAQNLFSGGNSILNTAFDPQSALFNQLQNQVSQQANAANAQAGLGGSAYGAGNTANTLQNFDINWQNQQLGRQATGLGAAGQAFSQGAATAGSPASLLSAAASGAINPLSEASNLAISPGTQLGSLNSILGSGAQQGGNILSSLQSFAGLPYNTQSTGANNALGALGNTVNIGNQQFTIPQQLMNDLQSYLGLGQSASGLSGQLGNLGQQQLFNSLSGIGGALGTGGNLLFGNSLGSSGGLLGLAGLNPLTSSAASVGTDFGGGGDLLGAGLGAATDFGGGGDLAAAGAGAAAAGGGFDIASLLPFAGLFGA